MERELLYSCIRKNRILMSASEENIERYFSDGSVFVECFHSGQVIYSKDSARRCVGMIISGKATCEPFGAKDNALLRMMSENDTFGVANLYCESEPFPSVITAKTAVKVLFIDGAAFCALVENDTAVLKAYLSFMSDKIVYLNKKISTLTAGTTEKKLAAYIAKNCDTDMGLPTVSMSALADMLGVGRASLYRALDELETLGLIRKDKKSITVIDKNALLSYTQC